MTSIGHWVRSWRRSPLLVGQFALTIAVGMGATTALVSLMLALGYQPLPYRDPGRLVAVWERPESGAGAVAISGPDLTDFARATSNVFASLGGFWIPRLWLIDGKGPTRVHICGIQAGAFSDLGIRPALGRAARPDDEPLTSSITAPAWISYKLWQSRYRGSSLAIGATIGIASNAAGQDQVQARVVGVLPRGVSIPLPFAENTTDVWYLLPRDSWMSRSRQSDVLFGVGRLQPGVTVAQAQIALDPVAERLAQRYSFDRGKRPVVESLEAIAQGPARRTMGLLALGVGLVFLVGCVNLAVLMGAEGRRRRREIAIRAALGADRWRLWREVAAEKSLLTVLSLALGVAFAFALLRVLVTLVPEAGLGPPLLHPPPLNLAVLFGFAIFALAAALVWSALLTRAADGPGSASTLAAAGSGLGYTGLTDSSPGAGRWRLFLLAVQAGIGICLLAAAALTATTYVTLSRTDLGPAPRRTVVLWVGPRENFVPSDGQVVDFNEQLLSRLQRLPGVQAIALANDFPPPAYPVSFRKQDDSPDTEREAVVPEPVSPGYFRTLGIPILFGRGFDDRDDSGSEPVAIISLNMAEKNWVRPKEAVGSEIFFGEKEEPKGRSEENAKGSSKEDSNEHSSRHYKIVGIVGNFRGYWSQESIPGVYLPLAQAAFSCDDGVILRSASPRAVAALAPQALAGMAIPAEISDVSTMQARWQATLTRPLARMAGMLLLALLGLGLSVQGVYAVAAATVAARRHELAVRAVLGALPKGLVWSVMRELVLAVMVGAGFGVAAALSLRPLLAHWLGAVAVWRAEPIIVAVVLMALAAAAGCYVPARAATRANPAEVLRQG